MPTLKQHRKRAVLSTRELAERADVSPATIWRIERGDAANVRPATMRAIAGVLNVQPASIDEFASVIGDNGRRTVSRIGMGWGESLNLATLIAQQGVRPITNPDQLAGDFWPEQEQAEDFLRTLRTWRQEGNSGKELD